MANGYAVPCQCRLEQTIAAALPTRLHRAKLTDFSEEIRKVVIGWVTSQLARANYDERTDGLLITGPVGTGKTYLAGAILRHLVEDRIGVKFCRCAELLGNIRETYRTNRSEATILDALEQVRFLVLDDLGSGSLSDHERRFTLELLERRLNKCKPTIVTTNWSLEEIGTRMDDRIASRLSTFEVVELGGDDRRTRRARSI